jgi:hypothetical protein
MCPSVRCSESRPAGLYEIDISNVQDAIYDPEARFKKCGRNLAAAKTLRFFYPSE